jgi:hypothetical protein
MLVALGSVSFASLMIQFLATLGTTYPMLQCNIPEDMNLHSLVVVSKLVHTDQSDIKHCNFKHKNIVFQYLGIKYHTDVLMLTLC